ncbi:hypothetical protein PVAP13_7NG172817 [Panicum virgatum]|uniref:Uncharacterized protein n=1 Tax=Panicum virgatum TaxID=38727 RepID=A0A8T0PUJ7_PANVG|nr:hypothetical protein PVAP13_7NG172817 [Panicum virgatum]
MAGGSNRDCSAGCPSFLHRAEPGLSRSSPLHLAARVSRQGLKQQGVVATTCCSCEPPRAQAAWRGRYCLLLVRAAKGSSSMAWPWRRQLGYAKSHHACRWCSNARVPWR